MLEIVRHIFKKKAAVGIQVNVVSARYLSTGARPVAYRIAMARIVAEAVGAGVAQHVTQALQRSWISALTMVHSQRPRQSEGGTAVLGSCAI